MKNGFRKINDVLRFVYNNEYSSFYRNKYKKAGVGLANGVKTVEDFEKIPFLTKEEILESDPAERFFLPWEEFSSVAISSGSLKGPESISVIYRGKPFEELKERVNKRNLKSFMYLLPPPQGSGSMLRLNEVWNKKKTVRVLGDVYNLPLSAKIASKIKLDSLISSPGILYFFLPFLERETDLDNIKYITLVGEMCTNAKARLFKQKFKNAEFFYSYGISEAQERFGFSCPHLNTLETNLFHPSSDFYFEVLESKEFVATTLIKNSFPLIRYKTGDLVEIEDLQCRCGKKQVLRFIGRAGFESAKVHGTIIYAHLLDDALESVGSLLRSNKWQLLIREEALGVKIMPKLTLRLVLEKGKESQEDRSVIAKRISENFLISSSKTLSNLVSQGMFLPLEVESIKGKESLREKILIIPN